MSASLQELRSIQRARSSEQNDGRDRRQHNNDGFEEALCDAVHEPQAEECAPDQLDDIARDEIITNPEPIGKQRILTMSKGLVSVIFRSEGLGGSANYRPVRI